MKKTIFFLAAMTALVLTSCSKSEDDEPEVKKPSIEEVLRLDDILYESGETADFDVMTAQYKKKGYELRLDERTVIPGLDILSGLVFFYNEQHCSLICHSMRGDLCGAVIYTSSLFTYDMKDDVVRYINKRFNIALKRSDESGYYLPDTKDVYRFSDGLSSFTLKLKDNSCEFSFGRLDIFD